MPSYVGSGAIYFGNTASVDVVYEIIQQFSWNVEADIEVFHTFSWNVGELRYYYWQIEGKNPHFIQLAVARSISELCEKINNYYLSGPVNYPIKKISRHSRPVSLTDIRNDELIGIDHSYDYLIDIEYCKVPECLELCMHTDALTEIGFETICQQSYFLYSSSGKILFFGNSVNNFRSYIGSGYVQFSNSATTNIIIENYAYESDGSVIFSGESRVVSPNWNYASSGEIEFLGQASIVSDYYTIIGLGGIQFGNQANHDILMPYNGSGNVLFNGTSIISVYPFYAFESSGFVNFNGESIVISSYYSYEGSGLFTLNVNSSFVSSNFHYSSNGSLNFNGSSVCKNSKKYIGEGNFVFSGESSPNYFTSILGSGNISFSSSAAIVSSNFSWSGSGAFEFFGNLSINVGDLLTEIGCDQYLLLLERNEEIENLESLSITQELITNNCSCGNGISNSINFKHNFVKNNLLFYFLNSNSFNIPSNVDLTYSDITESWKKSFVFNSPGNNWNISIEWGCVDQIAGDEFSQSFWKFSLFIKNNEKISRLLYHFNTSETCPNDLLDFEFKINVKTHLTESKTDTIGNSIFIDEIGLFKTKWWADNPNLIFHVSNAEIDNSANTINIRPIFPVLESVINV